MYVPKRYLAAIAALLAIIAGVLIWIAMPESCSSWKDRYVESLSRSIYGNADDRAAAREIASQRPAGCK